MRVELKNVQLVRAKGRQYAYHRPTKTRLHDAIGSPAFVRRVTQLNEQMARQPSAPAYPGTVADLVVRYRSSTAFIDLTPAAKAEYRRALDIIVESAGKLHAEKLTNGFMLDLRDVFATTPRKANALIMVFRRVLGIAVEREWIAQCPALAQKQQRLKEGPGYKPWPEPAIERFRAMAPREMVLAMELGLHTGQRQADLLALQWGQISNGEIELVQGKTGVELTIPVTRDLGAILAGIDRQSVFVLTTKAGLPWVRDNFRHGFGRAVRKCGLQGLVYHGLRHTAATRLAELGLSDRMIASITGHQSTASIKRYTRKASQKKLARMAMEKLQSS